MIDDINAYHRAFNTKGEPNQPRDSRGRWSSAGSESSPQSLKKLMQGMDLPGNHTPADHAKMQKIVTNAKTPEDAYKQVGKHFWGKIKDWFIENAPRLAN